mmetsp:Transcript_25874/g.83802  ORF Transcript_25874/g.83802 Transcript_25874/m.83802 type:complete len:305 (-) Transcript_25874:8-922(-)
MLMLVTVVVVGREVGAGAKEVEEPFFGEFEAVHRLWVGDDELEEHPVGGVHEAVVLVEEGVPPTAARIPSRVVVVVVPGRVSHVIVSSVFFVVFEGEFFDVGDGELRCGFLAGDGLEPDGVEAAAGEGKGSEVGAPVVEELHVDGLADPADALGLGGAGAEDEPRVVVGGGPPNQPPVPRLEEVETVRRADAERRAHGEYRHVLAFDRPRLLLDVANAPASPRPNLREPRLAVAQPPPPRAAEFLPEAIPNRDLPESRTCQADSFHFPRRQLAADRHQRIVVQLTQQPRTPIILAWWHDDGSSH